MSDSAPVEALQEQLTRERRQLEIVQDIALALGSILDLDELLARIAENVTELMDAERSTIYIVDPVTSDLWSRVAQGEAEVEIRLPMGTGIAGWVAQKGEVLSIADAYADSRFDSTWDAATGYLTRSILCAPMVTKSGQVIGVIQVLNKRGGPFDDEDAHLLEALSGMGGVAIENARLYENLEQMVSERTAALQQTLAELRETQAQLVQSEKMAALGDLVAGVAHEINTPLGAVRSNTDLTARALGRIRGALDDASQIEPARRFLERAVQLAEVSREACGRIDGIVRSLRNFARLDEAERKPADLHEGLDSTLTLVAHLLRERISVVRDYGSLPQVDCYPNQLNQVFLNILVNAAQAIEGKGEIRLCTRLLPGAVEQACVEISDSGAGIPPEILKRIFDPGFTTKGVGVGTGLGLAICYRIVANHKGRIEVDSSPGKGTTFRILLPVRAENGK
jgi:signal transduction histidine kinase